MLQAYHALALRWHPDRVHPSEREKASERFKRISEAYSTLRDPDKRRQYDMFGDTTHHQEPYSDGARQGRQGYPDGYFYHAGGYRPSYDNPFGFRFQFGYPSQPTAPRAKRKFYCSLAELNTGCKKKFTLDDTLVRRFLDACDARWQGPAAQIAMHLGALAVSFMWRFSTVVFGRPWWLRLPLFALLWVFTLAKQLPPSPSGVFEFEVKPGWREGTRVVYNHVEPKVAFELR